MLFALRCRGARFLAAILSLLTLRLVEVNPTGESTSSTKDDDPGALSGQVG